MIDPNTGESAYSKKLPLNLSILDTDDDKLMVASTSASVRFRIDEFKAATDAIDYKTRVDIPADLKEKIIHAEVERIEFPTFDTDPKTGEPRMLHAFLYHPKNPLPREQQLVMIQSFYGGGNNFSTRTQILAEAGIYVLSPSPRGSRGFGREFSALNDKDLGGNEIIDIIYAGQFISEHLGVPT